MSTCSNVTRSDAMASLQPITPRGAVRGPAEIFQKLFARPFGPRAVASYIAADGEQPPQVYGVSREDAARMDLLLGQIARAEHGQRELTGFVWLGAAALLGVVGVSELSFGARLPGETRTSASVWGGATLGLGALWGVAGVYALADPWTGERATFDFRAALGTGTDYARAFAAVETRLGPGPGNAAFAADGRSHARRRHVRIHGALLATARKDPDDPPKPP